MRRKNKRYMKWSVLALAVLLLSFFYHENSQKKIIQSFEGQRNAEANVTTETTDDRLEAGKTDALDMTQNKGETTHTQTSQPAVLSPQTITEPMTVEGVIVVNKRYPLPESYDPGENKEAITAFKKMNAEMRALGLDIAEEYSGYRSYVDQAALYQSYVEDDGKSEAERYSSRPGYSEHQTGLAFDFINTAGELVSSKKEADWIAENAHRYGFIVRYKEGQEQITGYMAESWHVRYVGMTIAEKIYQTQVTLEEYLGIEGGDYHEE